MKAFVILMISFGAGKYEVMSITRFDTMQECQAARAVVITEYGKDVWGKNMMPDDAAKCLEVK